MQKSCYIRVYENGRRRRLLRRTRRRIVRRKRPPRFASGTMPDSGIADPSCPEPPVTRDGDRCPHEVIIRTELGTPVLLGCEVTLVHPHEAWASQVTSRAHLRWAAPRPTTCRNGDSISHGQCRNT